MTLALQILSFLLAVLAAYRIWEVVGRPLVQLRIAAREQRGDVVVRLP